MRCIKHITDLSSSVGVCSSCLRDHLFILAASTQGDDHPLTIFRQKPVNNAVKSSSQENPLKKHPRSSKFSFLWKLFRFKPSTDHNVSGADWNPIYLTRNVSGFGFCLSPLVRRPKSRCRWKVPPEPHLSTSRSRKLSGFGKFNLQRSSV